MKTRIIQTKYWDDPLVIEAPVEARLLFIYYLTCSHVGLTGMFEIATVEVKLKTGLSLKQIEKAKQFLIDNGKVYHYKNWVCLVNAWKYNNYGVGEKNRLAYEKELNSIPQEVKHGLDCYIKEKDTSMGVLFSELDSNHKPETRNHNTEIGEIVKRGLELPPDEIDDIAQKYNVPIAFVLSKQDDVNLWVSEKPAKGRGRNLKATLQSWVKRDAINTRKEENRGRGKVSIDLENI